MTIRRLSLPLLLALVLAGCANGASDSAGASADAPAASSVAPSSAAPSPVVPDEEPGTTKPPAPGDQTLTGTITAGVEPNCLLLDDYLLIIDPALRSTAKAGDAVTVTGRAKQGMMTTCQQGTPFVVTAIRAN